MEESTESTQQQQQQQSEPQQQQQQSEPQPQPQPEPESTLQTRTVAKRKGQEHAAPKGKAKARKTDAAGSTSSNPRKQGVRRPTRIAAKEYSCILEDCSGNDERKEFVERSQAKAEKQKREYGGTCPRAGKEPPNAITSIPLIAKLLTVGLCDDPWRGIEISNGVYFKHAALGQLERYFNLEYVFDPKNIGVKLGVTKVEVDGEEFVVDSFDHGEYTLSDKSTMYQWDLLDKRIDGGVTLEAEQRRFIIHLVTTYINMMTKVVPAVMEESTASMVKTMLWDPAVARATESNPARVEELGDIIDRVNTLRDLTLRIFTGASVKDTLPSSFWDAEKNEELREFAEEAGSLKKMNFLDNLECEKNNDVLSGKLFTGEIVTGGFSGAPMYARCGSWKAKLRSVIVQLTCAYRLGRSANLLEAYYALSEAEIDSLIEHHSCWEVNLNYGLQHMDKFRAEQSTATDDDLKGPKSHALRFAVKRCRLFNPNIFPVTVVGCGVRNAKKKKYGSLQRDSLDSNYFCHARFGDKLVPPLMENESCRLPATAAIKSSEKLFKMARNGRYRATSEKSGGYGRSAKERQCRLLLLHQTPREREETMDMFMATIAENGCERLMCKVKQHDPTFVKWGKECLANAQTASTAFSHRSDFVAKSGDRCSEDHLFGNTNHEIAHGRERVSKLVANLENDGVAPKDISVFSVALALACLFSAACLRPQDFFGMVACRQYYKYPVKDDKGHVVKPERIMIRLPQDGKQTETAMRDPSRACMEHEILGDRVVEWWVVMSLLGRPFLAKHNDGVLDQCFGPLGTDGEVLTEYVFGEVLDSMGKAFFSTWNVDVNALRTVQESLAAEHMIELGIPKDSVIKDELSRQMRTSNEVSVCAYLIFGRLLQIQIQTSNDKV